MVKESGEPFGVPWHQDSESGGDGVYTVGAYIVGSGDNPLRVIPGSHRLGIIPPELIRETVQELALEVISVTANPGDLVIHNLNVLHESGPCGTDTRYTIFFEFRSVDMVKEMCIWGLPFVRARQHFVAAGTRARRSFADLLLEDQERKLSPAPFQEFWDFGGPTPLESEIDFRVSQSPDRWCLAPTPEHQRCAIEAFLRDGDIETVASRYGVSEEALFKWLCEAGIFAPNENGRYRG
ncbi:conserved hypothetical protein [Ricinus communis]|uniref:Phytanoyl-CoA dioxygenase n=1 Tax=Ricinus communis TaxID=3988 RepID=B9TFB9_RICCO|nr:conserved hypothetical protein [Ricinus communis]